MKLNGKSEIPTGKGNVQLSKGAITPSDLGGPLAGKTVADLTKLVKNDSEYRCCSHPNSRKWRNQRTNHSFKYWIHVGPLVRVFQTR
jgi:hypothetical protein